MTKPILYLAFANDAEDRLPLLTHEYQQVQQLLEVGDRKGQYSLRMEPFSTREKLHSDLVKYCENLQVFVFSGHAGRSVLLLEDGLANADGIALALQQCPNIQLVILNGCSTQGQVQQLLKMGIPVVIATSAPVDDSKAAIFSIRFFQALTHQANLEMAYNMAIAEIKSMDAALQHHRRASPSRYTSNMPTWGIFYQKANTEKLQFKLPAQVVSQSIPLDYQPNKALIIGLWKALRPHSDSIQEEIQEAKAQGRKKITLRQRRIAIINSLPHPVAVPLRKLMVPISDQNQGYDKVSLARLQQIGVCFENLVEFLVYVLMAQLWEMDDKEKSPHFSQLRKDIAHFFELAETERTQYDFRSLLLKMCQVLKASNTDLFIPQLKEIDHLFAIGHAFQNAYLFLHVLKSRLGKNDIAAHEIAHLCVQSEESLLNLLSELAFLAQYILATVKDIHVLRYRHLKTPNFNHKITELKWIMGGLDEKQIQLRKFMYSKSVLLLKKDTTDSQIYHELNLSPFIIDDNAFDSQANLGQLYFFYRYLPASETYQYRYTVRPEEMIELSGATKSTTDDEFEDEFDDFDDFDFEEEGFEAESDSKSERYDLMSKQFEVFRREVLHKNG